MPTADLHTEHWKHRSCHRPVLVLHLLHARAKRVSTGVATTRELGVVAGAAEDEGVLGGEGLLHQGRAALMAAEAVLKGQQQFYV